MSGDVDDETWLQTLLVEIVLGGLISVGPFAGWCVVAEEEECEGDGRDEDAGDNECHTPRNVWGEAISD